MQRHTYVFYAVSFREYNIIQYYKMSNDIIKAWKRKRPALEITQAFLNVGNIVNEIHYQWIHKYDNILLHV